MLRQGKSAPVIYTHVYELRYNYTYQQILLDLYQYRESRALVVLGCYCSGTWPASKSTMITANLMLV